MMTKILAVVGVMLLTSTTLFYFQKDSVGNTVNTQATPQITIYTKSTCPYCRRALSELQRRGFVPDTIDLLQHPHRRQEMLDKSNGRTTVPQVFVDGVHVGGYQDLLVWFEKQSKNSE